MLPFAPLAASILLVQALAPLGCRPLCTATTTVGPFTLYAEGLTHGLSLVARLLTMELVAFTAILATRAPDLLAALVRIRVPSSVAFAAAMALQLVPILRRELRIVLDAQRVRGLRVAGPTALARALVPVIVASVERAQQLAISLEARGFGSGITRTSYREVSLGPPRHRAGASPASSRGSPASWPGSRGGAPARSPGRRCRRGSRSACIGRRRRRRSPGRSPAGSCSRSAPEGARPPWPIRQTAGVRSPTGTVLDPADPGFAADPVPGVRDRARRGGRVPPAGRPPHVPHPLRRTSTRRSATGGWARRSSTATRPRSSTCRPTSRPGATRAGRSSRRSSAGSCSTSSRRSTRGCAGSCSRRSRRGRSRRCGRRSPSARAALLAPARERGLGRPRRGLRPGLLAGDHLRPDRRRAGRPRDDQAPLGRHRRDVRARRRRGARGPARTRPPATSAATCSTSSRCAASAGGDDLLAGAPRRHGRRRAAHRRAGRVDRDGAAHGRPRGDGQRDRERRRGARRPPRPVAALRAGEVSIRDAIEEILRYDPPLQWFERWVLDDGVALGGSRSAPGSRVALVIGAANRDPRRFPDPDRFDITARGHGPPLVRRRDPFLHRRAAGAAGARDDARGAAPHRGDARGPARRGPPARRSSSAAERTCLAIALSPDRARRPGCLSPRRPSSSSAAR